MPIMVHGDFKPGEVCRADGQYRCVTCAGRSRESNLKMEKARSFPECPSCKERGALEIDTIWKKIPGS